ncbi:hypothetical protein T310_5602, partial [Rasamsonia emersonii CBS 393.64]
HAGSWGAGHLPSRPSAGNQPTYSSIYTLAGSRRCYAVNLPYALVSDCHCERCVRSPEVRASMTWIWLQNLTTARSKYKDSTREEEKKISLQETSI